MKFNSRSSSEKLVGDLKILKGGRVALLTEDGKYEFAAEDIADGVALPDVGTTLKKVSVRTNGNCTVLYGFAPSRGTQIVRFKGFSHKKDDECAPWTMQGGERKGRDGKKWYQEDKLMFTALLDIIDGDFLNCEVGLSLPYIFSKGKDGMAILDGGSKTIEKIVRFFELCGISLEDEEFSYEDNVLPMLEDILLEVADDHVFQVEIEDGYVKNATDLPTGLEKHYIKGKAKAQVEDDDFEDEDEEPQPKKSSKRQPEPVDEDEDEEEEQPKRKASREPMRETAKPDRRQPVVEDDDDEEDEEPAKPARRNFRKSSRDEVI
jgi:hypothetical protein